MQWEHVVMLTGQYFVTNLNDQVAPLFAKPFARKVRVGGCFL